MNRKSQTILITIGANALLIVLRLVLAYMSGSLALKANAWHSIADLVVLGVVYLGLVLSAQYAGRFAGLIARAENVTALIVALFILYMGVELFSEAISREQVELGYVVWAAVGSFIGVCITYFMGRYLLYVGEREQSPSLLAAGYHARMDMLASSAVLVGLVGAIFGMTGLDKVAATIVVVLILLAVVEIFTANWQALRRGGGVVAGHEPGPGWTQPGKALAVVLVLLCVAGYLISGFFVVRPDEQAIVRRFGQVTGPALGAGLHYRWPYPVERVDLVRVTDVREVDTEKKLLLTGDENLIELNLAVHYRVKDPVQFLLNAADPEQVVRNAAESGVRTVVGRKRLDALLTGGREELRAETHAALQAELDRNRVGLDVASMLILDIVPPAEVKEAFEDVASAREDRATYVNEAKSFYNSVIPEARGQAAENLRAAEAYKAEKTNAADGEATRFLNKVTAYAKARDVTRLRLYLETMEQVLPGVKKFLIGPGVKTDGTDLWFLGPGAEAPMTGLSSERK